MTGYVFDAGSHGKFDPDGRVEIADHAAHNRAVEAAELAAWAEKPERFAAYVVKDIVATWLGTKIGHVVQMSDSRNPLTGSKMTSVRVVGTNGATYHGRYGSDWSQLVRLRRCKSN